MPVSRTRTPVTLKTDCIPGQTQSSSSVTDRIFHIEKSRKHALILRPLERARKHLVHGRVMKQYTAQDGKVPDIMAPAKVIEPAGHELLWHLERVNDGTDHINGHALHDRSIKVVGPRGAAGQVELHEGREARGAQGDVEGDAGPGHVGAVEEGVPGDDGSAQAEDGGGDDVDPAAQRLAVKGRVFGRDDGGGDEEGDARVVDAGETLEECLVGDAVHCVPHAAADEALARSGEEDCGEEDVGVGGEGEVVRGRVEVEGDDEDDDEADGVGPDVDRFVGEVESRGNAVELGLGEAVATEDVRIDSPRGGQVLVTNKPSLPCKLHRVLDTMTQSFLCLSSLLDTLIDDFLGALEPLFCSSPSLVHDRSESAIAYAVCSSLEVR